MKMFKRFAAALLAGVMVLAMLTACGGGSGSGASSDWRGNDCNQCKYIACDLTTLPWRRMLQKLENDTDLRNKALAQLQKIKDDGTIAVTDANTSIVTPQC